MPDGTELCSQTQLLKQACPVLICVRPGGPCVLAQGPACTHIVSVTEESHWEVSGHGSSTHTAGFSAIAGLGKSISSHAVEVVQISLNARWPPHIGVVYLHHGDGTFPFWEVPCSDLRYLHAQLFTTILCMSTRD